MKRSTVRAFGIAIFLTGALYTSMQQFHFDLSTIGVRTGIDVNNEKKIIELNQQLASANKKIQSLETKLNQSDTIKTTKTDTKSNTLSSQGSEKNDNKANTDSTTNMKTYSLEIYRNMTPYSIGEKLEDAGIVQNAIELEMYLAKNQYAGKLQIGSFELNSSMTLQEIADTITKTKPKDEETR